MQRLLLLFILCFSLTIYARKPKKSVPPKENIIQADFIETALGVDMKFRWVEAGAFVMGCGEDDADAYQDEKIERNITLDGFYIGIFEVTQAQWEKVMGTSIYQQQAKVKYSSTYGVGPDYPMYYVSWDEAVEFCKRLSKASGKSYSLPTEAQWEYAARGQQGYKYAGSDNVKTVAWYNENSGEQTHPCGTKRANGFGIYDMSGNVWEWCKDRYNKEYILSDHESDYHNPTTPEGWEPPSGYARVNRGGSWDYSANFCRVTCRSGDLRDYRADIGFRVVLVQEKTVLPARFLNP